MDENLLDVQLKEEDNDPYDTTTGSSASSDSGGTRPISHPTNTAPINPPPTTVPNAAYYSYPPPPPPHMIAAASYGPNYYEYLDYYNSWGAIDPRDYNVVPARAYRVLSNPGASPLDAPYAKCPRIVTKNHITNSSPHNQSSDISNPSSTPAS